MAALCGFVRATPLAYVNNQDGNSAAADGRGCARFMPGLQYASRVASRPAGSQGRPSTPPHYAQAARAAPPALNALAAWPRAHASGTVASSPQPRGAPEAHLMGHRSPSIGLASSYGYDGGSGVASTSAAARLSSRATVPGAASTPPYGNVGGGVGALGPVVGPQTRSRVPELRTGSSAYMPFCGPHARGRPPIPQAVPAESSLALRGPVDDDGDDEQAVNDGDEEQTPHGSPGRASPRPMAGVLSTPQRHKKWRGATTTRCSPPTSSLTQRGGPPGAGGAAADTAAAAPAGGGASVGGVQQPRAGSLARTGTPSPASGVASPHTRGSLAIASGATPPCRAGGSLSTAVAGATSSSGLVMAAHVSDSVRTTGVGFAGVRRQITTQRKEVATTNSQLRAVTKKVDDIAVLADGFTVSLVPQRRTIVAMSAEVTSMLSHGAASRAAASPPAAGDADGSGGAGVAGRCAGDDAQTPGTTEEHDAQWVLDLKVWCFLTGASSETASGLWCTGARSLSSVSYGC